MCMSSSRAASQAGGRASGPNHTHTHTCPHRPHHSQPQTKFTLPDVHHAAGIRPQHTHPPLPAAAAGLADQPVGL